MTSAPFNYKSFGNVIRWTAKLTSLLSIGILLLFFIGEGFNPTKLSLKEWMFFLFFPLGVILGLLIGWKKEFIGSLIAILSLTAFCLLETINGGFPGLAFFVFASPGLLFLISHFVTCKLDEHKINQTNLSLKSD